MADGGVLCDGGRLAPRIEGPGRDRDRTGVDGCFRRKAQTMSSNRNTPRAVLLLCAIAGLALLLGASPVRAAPPAGGPPVAANAPNSAGEEASNHFKRGLQLFDEADYTLALVEFERAYQLAPNYRALYNIALVDMQLGRYADAARTLEQYVHDGGSAIAPSRRAEVNKPLGELKFRTAIIEISLNVPRAEVMLDGKP